MKEQELREFIAKHKVIVIVRRLYGEDLIKLARALYEGGLRLMEVTFDQADPDCLKKTSEAIAGILQEMGEKMHVGAGTVLSTEQVDAAAAAGAEYIISPNSDPEVIRWTKKKGLISIPGAMTSSEMVLAHKSGADFVKVFPICDLGVSYMKNVIAPLNHIKFIATAGVTEQNLPEYLKIGMAGAGVSGRLTDKKLIKEGNFAELTNRARAFVEIAGAGEV